MFEIQNKSSSLRRQVRKKPIDPTLDTGDLDLRYSNSYVVLVLTLG